MITVVVVGKERMLADIRQVPVRVLPEIRKATEVLAIKLSAYVKRDKLSGQVLKNRTGTLRRSINYKVTATGTDFMAMVGTNKEYAHVHEFGFNGTVTVKEHLRMMRVAFGKEMRNPRQVTVRAHSMHMKMPERSFLRTALAEFEPTIRQEYEIALQRALR